MKKGIDIGNKVMRQVDTIEKTKQHFDKIAASYAESSDGKFCAPALAFDVEPIASFL